MLEYLHSKGWLDRMAIGLSGLCAIHCVLTALFLGALTSMGHIFSQPWIHETGLAIAIVLAGLAFYGGVRRHRAIWPLVIGGLGLALMALGLLLPHGAGEAVFTIAGVVLVALGHYFNHRCRHGACTPGN